MMLFNVVVVVSQLMQIVYEEGLVRVYDSCRRWHGAERARRAGKKGVCHFNEAIKNLLTFVGLSGRCQ